MEETPGKASITKKTIILLLKIAVTIACLWYVATKIDFAKAGAALQKANWFFLLPAFMVFAISKIVAAVRLNIYFRNINIHLPQWQNIKLFSLGMFYNLFLPGAITGDAYKVILLSKRYNISYKKPTAAVLLDRFSGLLALGLIVAVYGAIVLKEKIVVLALIAAAVLAIPLLFFIVKKYFPDFLPGFWSTFILGALVQGCMLISVYFILFSLSIFSNSNIYIFIFLLAAIASVLPIAVGGGLGVREFVIIEAAKYAGVDQHAALLLSLLFYLITVVCSLIGVLFVFKNPVAQKPVVS
ncbi:MAG TPA: lysylphosphatidylglycerol synthase transmembrane domain-containing protein [Chitinophagaceae bacterium]